MTGLTRWVLHMHRVFLGSIVVVLIGFPIEGGDWTAEARANAHAPTAVRDVQKRLAELKFLQPSQVEGKLGPRTRDAITAFQQWNGLAPDGIVGPQTRASSHGRGPSPRRQRAASTDRDLPGEGGHAPDRQRKGQTGDSLFGGQTRLRNAQRLLPNPAQGPQGLVAPIQDMDAVRVIFPRRLRVARRRRAHLSRVPRLRAPAVVGRRGRLPIRVGRNHRRRVLNPGPGRPDSTPGAGARSTELPEGRALHRGRRRSSVDVK